MIFYQKNGWKQLEHVVNKMNPGSLFIIVDENTAKLCLGYFKTRFNAAVNFSVIQIPPGEKHKNIHTCISVWEELSRKGADRNSLVINLGGGVVTDLGGFAAATFMRGIPFINIPTSLLAMVDASVGGKTGVDLNLIKNQIGTITLPEMVLIDTEFLKTLPERQIVSGFAEMIKHAIIDGKESWEKIRQIPIGEIPRNEKLISESIAIKERIVKEDPTEKGIRKILNFGHSLGHAIETHFLSGNNYSSVLHGEAIAAGMVLASFISYESGILKPEVLDEITSFIVSVYPKLIFEDDDIKNIINLMAFDKKNRNGEVLFVLPEDIGRFRMNCKADNNLVIRSFTYYRNI